MAHFSLKARISLFVSILVAGVASFFVMHRYSVERKQALPKTVHIKTAYGSMDVSEPVVIELLHSNAMQRLKKINQYGIMAYLRPEQKYDRYQHSVAVFYLLRKFGASLEEQLAGLLHDVSHTVFSHVADYLHNSVANKYSYQDSIFKWYLDATGLKAILEKYNMENVCNFGQEGHFTMLKDDLPRLCADRLEYNLYGGYLEGWIKEEDLPRIVSHVHYKDGQWFFDDTFAARIFGDISIRLSNENWCASYNAFVLTLFSQVLKRALDSELIDIDDFHFSTDDEVWAKLTQSNDEIIQNLLDRIFNYQKNFSISASHKPYDIYVKTKFRGIDPLVLQKDQTISLSAIDNDFKAFYDASKVTQHHYLAYS